MDFPMTAFCLNGNNEKIELTIDEVLGFPENTSLEGGYDFIGHLAILVGSFEVHCSRFYASTGILYHLLLGLQSCYKKLAGNAEYKPSYGNDFWFTLEMTHNGHAEVTGMFCEFPHLANKLNFEMATDQTCILEAINALKAVEKIFGGDMGKRAA